MSLYLQETLRIAPHLQRPCIEQARDRYLPAARAAGLRAHGFWRVASFKGDPSAVVALWELDGWEAAAQLTEAAHGARSTPNDLRSWYEISGQWVAKRAALLSRQRSQHIDKFQRRAMSTRFCWHETMIIQPNREQDYVLGIEAQLGRSYDLQGMQMVWEFQPVFRSGLIINFWTVPNGFDSIALMGRQEADDFHSGQYWMDIAVALREHWRSVWLVPLPIDLKA
jgi:hypothetical protein